MDYVIECGNLWQLKSVIADREREAAGAENAAKELGVRVTGALVADGHLPERGRVDQETHRFRVGPYLLELEWWGDRWHGSVSRFEVLVE